MKSVFVSYSRSDSSAVGRLVAQLKEAGYRVWHDVSLTGGQHWWDSILEEIRRCDIFLFALSRESIDSEACRRELDYAAALERRLVPVRVNVNISPQNLARPLAEIQVVDFLKPESDLLRVVCAINLAAPASPPPDPPPAAPSLPVSYLGGVNERLHASGELAAADQKSLCTDLRIALDEGHSPAEIRGAVQRFLQRPELLATVKAQLDSLLATLRAAEHGSAAVVAKAPAEPKATALPAISSGRSSAATGALVHRTLPWTPLRVLSALLVLMSVPMTCLAILVMIVGDAPAAALLGLLVGSGLAIVALRVPEVPTPEQKQFRSQWLRGALLVWFSCLAFGIVFHGTPIGPPVGAMGLFGLASHASVWFYRWCSVRPSPLRDSQ